MGSGGVSPWRRKASLNERRVVEARTGTLQSQEQGLVAQLRLPVEATPMAVNLITRVTTSADPTIAAFVAAVRREARRVGAPIH